MTKRLDFKDYQYTVMKKAVHILSCTTHVFYYAGIFQNIMCLLHCHAGPMIQYFKTIFSHLNESQILRKNIFLDVYI